MPSRLLTLGTRFTHVQISLERLLYSVFSIIETAPNSTTCSCLYHNLQQSARLETIMRSFQPFFLQVIHLVYYSFLGLDAAFVLPSIGIRPSRFITNNLHPQSSPYTINLGFASGTQLYQSSTPPTEKDLKELPPLQHSTIDRENDKEVSSIKLDANGYRTGSLRAATAAYGRVPYGEESRKYRRTVFDYDDWVTHRNTEKIVTNLKGMFFSGVIRQLREEVLFVTLASALVVFWNDFLIFPDEFINGFMLPKLILPALPFTLSSPALGLLLVFKTNASYARWSEARTTWSKLFRIPGIW